MKIHLITSTIALLTGGLFSVAAQELTNAPGAPAASAAIGTTATNVVVRAKAQAIKKADPFANAKLEWADEPTGLKTQKGNPVKVPYLVTKNGKKAAAFKRWGAWQPARNNEERLRAIADAKVAQEDQESGKATKPAPPAKLGPMDQLGPKALPANKGLPKDKKLASPGNLRVVPPQ